MARPYKRIGYTDLDVSYYDIKAVPPSVEGQTFYIQLEDGFNLLQEDSFALLLEEAP